MFFLLLFLNSLECIKLLMVLSKQLYNVYHTYIFTTLLNCESQLQLPRKTNTLDFNNWFSLFSVLLAARVLFYTNGNQNRMRFLYNNLPEGRSWYKWSCNVLSSCILRKGIFLRRGIYIYIYKYMSKHFVLTF